MSLLLLFRPSKQDRHDYGRENDAWRRYLLTFINEELPKKKVEEEERVIKTKEIVKQVYKEYTFTRPSQPDYSDFLNSFAEALLAQIEANKREKLIEFQRVKEERLQYLSMLIDNEITDSIVITIIQ